MFKQIIDLIAILFPNVCVIIVFAYILTRTRFFNEILERDKPNLSSQNQLILILVFGIFSIYGTIGGIEFHGAIVNIRDLGPEIAGLVGGPIAGIGAGIIGGLYRLSLGGYTMIPCSLAPVIAGFLGGIIFLLLKKRCPSLLVAIIFTSIMELIHMGFILLFAQPYSKAMELVEIITIPMVMANALGMTIFFFMVKNLTYELKTKKKKDMIEGELQGAKEIQMSIIPRTYPAFPDINEIDLCATLKPAKEVGGDLYDYYLLDENKKELFFMVGDVSGKGVPASLFMVITMTLFIANIKVRSDLTKIVQSVNNQFLSKNESNMFVTLFCGVLNIETGEINYVNAGHNPPLIIRAGGKPGFIPSTGNLVLGIMDDIPYKSESLTLNSGDTLLLYTDGVTEAFNTQNELYSEKRLLEIAENINELSSKKGVEKILTSVEEFSRGMAQSDDITIFIMRYKC